MITTILMYQKQSVKEHLGNVLAQYLDYALAYQQVLETEPLNHSKVFYEHKRDLILSEGIKQTFSKKRLPLFAIKPC